MSAIASLNRSFIISGVCSSFHPGFSAPTRDDRVVETWYLRQGIKVLIMILKSGRWIGLISGGKGGREIESDGRKG